MSSASQAARQSVSSRRSIAIRGRRPTSLPAATATTSQPMSTISDDVLIFCLVFLAAAALMVGQARAQTASLDVELKLTDQDYQPIAGEPIRLVFGVGD